MAARPLAIDLNIHKKHKYLKSQPDAGRRIAPNSAEAAEAAIAELAKTLRAHTPVGRALRVLAERIRHPQTAYNDEELRQLILVSLAELRNRRKP